jgi:glycosyltransferase involved in cell wall biosynthesis
VQIHSGTENGGSLPLNGLLLSPKFQIQPMNVLLVVPWDQEFGGVACVVGNLAKYLTNDGHNVMFLHPGSDNILQRKVTKCGFPGFEINLREPHQCKRPLRSILAFVCFLPFTLFRLLALLKTSKIQIVNIHYPGDAFIYFALLRLILGFKLVVSVHGADFYPNGRPRLKDSWPLRFLLSMADFIVAPSRAFLLEFLKLSPRLDKKATAIHNGIDPGELCRTPPTHQANRNNYILCIAHQNEKKNLELLLRAFARLKDVVDPTLELALVGDGPLRSTLEDLAHSLNLGDRINFMGWKSRKEVAELLAGCTVFVLPSKSEPFGIVIIEAMACKKPVVASCVGGIPEIIENGENGIMVDPHDPSDLARAIETLLKNPALRESLGTKGHRTVQQRFTHETMGRQYHSLFTRLLDAA